MIINEQIFASPIFGLEAETNKTTFNEAISCNLTVKKYLDEKAIAQTLQPENYVGHSEEIIKNVLDAL